VKAISRDVAIIAVLAAVSSIGTVQVARGHELGHAIVSVSVVVAFFLGRRLR
jgi:hypothetical protein